MRQRDYFEGATVAADLEASPDDFVQLFEREELRDRQFTDGNDEARSQQIDLPIHPRRTISDFVWRWNAIATRGRFPGETSADRREVNLRADFRLIQVAEFLEPTEEGAACGPCEGPAQHGLFHSGRLTDEHDLAENRAAGNRGWQHARTTPALEQVRDMLIEQLLPAR
jgi:hypothetical protein